MSTELKWSKTGLRLVCDVPARPAPRTRTSYPMPPMPIAAQYLAVALETITGAGAYTTGIRLTSVTQLPGSTASVYNVIHTATQGSTVQTEVLPVTYPLNTLITAPLSGATHTFALVVTDGSQTTKYAAVSVQTPADTTAQQIETAVSDASDAKTGVDAINSADCLTNADKISLVESWRAELQTQASLDASADALLITTAKTNYDNAITALSVGLIAAGAPSNWATIWPDGTTLGKTGITSSLAGWWATIASKRAALQTAIGQAQSSEALETAISTAAQDALAKANAARDDATAIAAQDALAKANAAQLKVPSAATWASTALPTLPSTSYVAGSCWLTTDGKTYQVTPDGKSWQPVAFYASALIGKIYANQITITGDNLVPNPTGEVTDPPSGSYEAAGLLYKSNLVGTKLTVNGYLRYLLCPASGNVFKRLNLVPCKTGESFYAECLVAHTNVTNGTTWLGMSFLGADGVTSVSGGDFYSTQASNTYDANAPATLSLSATAPAGAQYVALFVQRMGPSTQDLCLFNNFLMRRMADGNMLVDGGITAKKLAAQIITSRELVLSNTSNLIPNPNSELAAPTGGWPSGAYEAAGLHTGDAYSGTKCRSNTAASGQSADLFVTGLIPVKTGQSYLVEGQIAIGTTGGYAFMIVTAHNASGGYVGNLCSTSAKTTTDGYSLFRASGTVQPGTEFIRLDLYVVGCTGYFDALGLYLMHDANLIVDGTLQALFARIARAIQSTNYAAGSSGNAPVGFCLSSTPFLTTFKDGTTDAGCLMELGGSANFGGYKVATINTQVMTAVNRIVNGTFWYGAYAPWSARPNWSYTLTAAPYTNTTYPLQTVVTAVQNFNAPGYTSGTVYLKFTPSATFVRNSGGGTGAIAATIKVYLRNNTTGVVTQVYSGAGNASYPSPGTWAPGQQSVDVTSYLSAVPTGYGIAVVITAYMENNNGSQANTTSYTGTIDVIGFELVF